MRLVLLALVVTACATTSSRPASPAASTSTATTTSAAAPATACPAPGAGTVEMRSYFLVLLHRGPTWTAEKTPETQRLFEGHMANIQAMARTGKLVLAGPFDAPATDKDAIAGLFLFDVSSKEEVETMIARDPAIAAQRLVPEILTWYGPAGLTYPGQLEVLTP